MYIVLVLVFVISQLVYSQEPPRPLRNTIPSLSFAQPEGPKSLTTWVNTVSEEYMWDNDSWELWSRITNTYNSAGKITFSTEDVFEAGTYLFSYPSTYTYDFSGNNTEILVQFKRDSTLMNKYKHISLFSGNNLLQTEIFEWDEAMWKPGYKWVYAYNWNGTVKTIEYYEYFVEFYSIINRKVFTYDSNRNPVEVLTQDYASQTWNDIERRVLTYNQNLLIQEDRFLRENNNWALSLTFTHAYNSYNKIDSTIIDSYHNGNHTVSKTTYTYDGNMNAAEKLEQTWYQSNLNNIRKTTYTYQNLTNVEENELVPLSTLLYQNFPNPFNAQTVISFQLAERENVEINIFNQIGQKLTTLVNEDKEQGTHKVEWNASDYPSGIYFCELKTSNRRLTNKLILLK